MKLNKFLLALALIFSSLASAHVDSLNVILYGKQQNLESLDLLLVMKDPNGKTHVFDLKKMYDGKVPLNELISINFIPGSKLFHLILNTDMREHMVVLFPNKLYRFRFNEKVDQWGYTGCVERRVNARK